MRWRALLFWLLLGGCTGTETGNPSLTGSLGYDAYSTSSRVVALVAAPDEVTDVTVVDSAWLVLGDVGFVAQSDCSRRDEPAAHAPGLGAGDHAVATPAPATRFDVEVGRYCGVTLPLMAESTIPAGAPMELAGRSILIQGQRPGERRFRIASSQQSELFLRAADAAGFELSDESSGVLIGFDVARWLSPLDWAAATPSDGDIVIDQAHNPELLAEFERHLAAGIALFVDRDRDGKLDPQREKIADAE